MSVILKRNKDENEVKEKNSSKFIIIWFFNVNKYHIQETSLLIFSTSMEQKLKDCEYRIQTLIKLPVLVIPCLHVITCLYDIRFMNDSEICEWNSSMKTEF